MDDWQPKSYPPRWEYKSITVPDAEMMVAMMNRMGAEGWEAFATYSGMFGRGFYAKRAIWPTPASPGKPEEGQT